MEKVKSSPEKWQLLRLGFVDYGEAHDLQKRILQDRIDDNCPDHLILLQHNPVITVGRGGDNSNIITPKPMLESFGISVFEIERGGDVTYHGPGQITGYPIIDLRNYKKDVHWYLRQLEEVIIRVLAEYKIIGKRVEEYTGVWVDDEKIAAIGVAVKKWVTYHGFAFNVNPDLSHFKLINPCGITDKEVTSLAKVLSHNVDINEVEERIISAFEEIFSVEIIYNTNYPIV
jgi:lipoyl(octanoyl) transferase